MVHGIQEWGRRRIYIYSFNQHSLYVLSAAVTTNIYAGDAGNKTIIRNKGDLLVGN